MLLQLKIALIQLLTIEYVKLQKKSQKRKSGNGYQGEKVRKRYASDVFVAMSTVLLTVHIILQKIEDISKVRIRFDLVVLAAMSTVMLTDHILLQNSRRSRRKGRCTAKPASLNGYDRKNALYYSRKGRLLDGVPCSNFEGKHSMGVCQVANFGELDTTRLEKIVGADDFGNYIYLEEKKAMDQFRERGYVGKSTETLCQLCYNFRNMMT